MLLCILGQISIKRVMEVGKFLYGIENHIVLYLFSRMIGYRVNRHCDTKYYNLKKLSDKN